MSAAPPVCSFLLTSYRPCHAGPLPGETAWMGQSFSPGCWARLARLGRLRAGVQTVTTWCRGCCAPRQRRQRALLPSRVDKGRVVSVSGGLRAQRSSQSREAGSPPVLTVLLSGGKRRPCRTRRRRWTSPRGEYRGHAGGPSPLCTWPGRCPVVGWGRAPLGAPGEPHPFVSSPVPLGWPAGLAVKSPFPGQWAPAGSWASRERTREVP